MSVFANKAMYMNIEAIFKPGLHHYIALQVNDERAGSEYVPRTDEGSIF